MHGTGRSSQPSKRPQSSKSYLSKLPPEMLQSLYKDARKPVTQPTEDINNLIRMKLREIERQYHAEESAKIVSGPRALLGSPTTNQRACGESSRSADDRLTKTSKAPEKSKPPSKSPGGADLKLSQLLGSDYIRPKATISAEDVSNYLSSKAGLSRKGLDRCMAEYMQQREKDMFKSQLGRIVSFSKPQNCYEIPERDSKPVEDAAAGRAVLSISDFRELVSSSGLTTSLFRSSAGKVFDSGRDKINLLTQNRPLCPVEEDKRKLENKRRILLKALKHTNSYVGKEAIISQLKCPK